MRSYIVNYIKTIVVAFTLITQMASAFEVEPFEGNQPLLETFSTNCLQMTQSQQMLKAYMMIGLNSSFNSPKESLERAIPVYDKRMLAVREYFHEKLGDSADAKRAFDEALALWNESKEMLQSKPTKANALKIRTNFLTMINKLLAGTKPLATPELELISLTGKLCRKPLEITIDYLMRIWEIEIPNYTADVKQTIENYHTNLATLSKNKLNNQASTKLLAEAKKQFLFFEFMYDSDTTQVPSLLSKKADQNFIIIRNIKKEFKKQASR